MTTPREPDKRPRRPVDKEIQAMAAITRALASLDEATQARIAQWAARRYTKIPGTDIPEERFPP